MSKVDLHVHTTASDGRYTPTEIVRRAAKSGLALLAITDHDTVDGIPEALAAAREFRDLEVIPGVEINTDVATGEAHVLGYFIDYTHPELLSVLRDIRASRQERAQKMVAKLADLGMPLDWARVRQLAGTEAIGRPTSPRRCSKRGTSATSGRPSIVTSAGMDRPTSSAPRSRLWTRPSSFCGPKGCPCSATRSPSATRRR